MTSSGKSGWAHGSEYLFGPLNNPEPYQEEGYFHNRRPPSSGGAQRGSSLNAGAGSARKLQRVNNYRPIHSRSSSDSFVSPLEKLKQEHKAAHRAPHLRRAIPRDTIDSLDSSFRHGGLYHHEGPYDATLASRQIPGRAPVDALKYSNAQALAATPQANIIDAITKKKPLQGVGLVPPGLVGPGGETFHYEEDDIDRREGNLGRWPGVKYLDDDIKGKGEPSYSSEEREKALKAQRKARKGLDFDGRQVSSGRRRAVSEAAQYPYSMLNEPSPPKSRLLGGLRRKLSLKKRK